MSFWAIELEPGKAHETIPPFDLHVTQAVLGAKAKDQGRTVVQCKVSEDESEEGRGSTFAIASLKLDLQENANLDLIFEAGKEHQFSVVGKNAVTLLGYYINDQDNMGFDDEDDEDIDSMDEEDGLEGLGGSDDDELDQNEDDEDEDEEEVDEEEIQALQKQLASQNKKRQAEPQAQNSGAKKAKTDAAPQQNQQKAQTPQPKQQGQQTPQPKQQGGQQQKTPQQQGGQQKQQTPGAQKQGGQQQQQKEGPGPEGTRRTLPGGLQVQTVKAGLGAQAQVGKKVRVHYVGRLTNGKVFDKSNSPFAFRLGGGEVIKGWDMGVQGMRVGEKRKLIIPPGLAYGNRGMPGLPAGSTLHFDVELISV